MFYSATELTRCFEVNFEYILHVGAHEAEELEDYISAGAKHIFWVEAQMEKAEQLRERLDADKNSVICAVVWNEKGVPLKLRIASNSESSSVYEMSKHSSLYPEITELSSVEVITTTLDSIVPSNFSPSFLNMDIQGSELNALKGFGNRLLEIDALYLEVNKSELYFGIPHFDEITNYLRNQGFRLASVKWWKRDGWGDAVYLRSSARKEKQIKRLILTKIYIAIWHLQNSIRIVLNR